MKKILKLLITNLLVLTVVSNTHVHDENCHYDPVTKTGCIYEINLTGLLPDEGDPKN